MADLLYTEYSLEEVVYQLAKVMFTQSLTRGSAEAQQALQKFTNFLEMEASQGHISRALEKKVLGEFRYIYMLNNNYKFRAVSLHTIKLEVNCDDEFVVVHHLTREL